MIQQPPTEASLPTGSTLARDWRHSGSTNPAFTTELESAHPPLLLPMPTAILPYSYTAILLYSYACPSCSSAGSSSWAVSLGRAELLVALKRASGRQVAPSGLKMLPIFQAMHQ